MLICLKYWATVMKDLTKFFPQDATNYTVIDVSRWQWWRAKEQDMLEWLKNFDHPSWFAWERPNGTMVFESQEIAELFVLRWS